MDRDHPYQISVKHNEIRKKENINMRITAMHTAAANPNGQFLKRLLEMNPDARNNSDERGRRPIHYAAASYSSEPLQILFKVSFLRFFFIKSNLGKILTIFCSQKISELSNSTIKN